MTATTTIAIIKTHNNNNDNTMMGGERSNDNTIMGGNGSREDNFFTQHSQNAAVVVPFFDMHQKVVEVGFDIAKAVDVDVARKRPSLLPESYGLPLNWRRELSCRLPMK